MEKSKAHTRMVFGIDVLLTASSFVQVASNKSSISVGVLRGPCDRSGFTQIIREHTVFFEPYAQVHN